MKPDIIILALNSVTLIFVALTLIVYYFQLRAMRHAAQGQHFLALVQFLQDSDVRAAREIIHNDLKGKEFSKWDRKDKETASTVCSSYGTAGVLVRVGLIDFGLLQSYRDSVITCFETCRPLIEERRKASGPQYWIDFDNLYRRFKQSS